ncbi:MAG: hypothetical protein ING24_01570 [Roseomonas sp.]|nr:hypothetical protein [Roseomonas sp.]
MRRAVTVIRQGQRSRKPERRKRIGVILSLPGISVRAPPSAERDKLNQTLAAYFLKGCGLKFAQFNPHCSLIFRRRIEVKAKIAEGCSAADFALGKTPDFKRWDGFFPKPCQMMVRRRNIIRDYPTQCSDAVLKWGSVALPDTRTGPYASRQPTIYAPETCRRRRPSGFLIRRNRCPGPVIKPQPVLLLPAEMLRQYLPRRGGEPHRIEMFRPGDKEERITHHDVFGRWIDGEHPQVPHGLPPLLFGVELRQGLCATRQKEQAKGQAETGKESLWHGFAIPSDRLRMKIYAAQKGRVKQNSPYLVIIPWLFPPRPPISPP